MQKVIVIHIIGEREDMNTATVINIGELEDKNIATVITVMIKE